REPRAPRGACTDVPAYVAEQAPHVRSVAVAVGSGESATTPELGSELDEKIGRRQPAKLHAIVVEPPAEERLVRERRVLEVPGVLVDLVLVADSRQETPALQREAAAESKRLEKRLLDLELVIGSERGYELAAEVGVDVARDDELGLAKVEAARRRRDFSARGREAADLVGVRIERTTRHRALEDDGNVGIERIRSCGTRGRLRGRFAILRICETLLELLHLLLQLPQRLAQLRKLR